MFTFNRNPYLFVAFSYEDDRGNRYASIAPLRAARKSYTTEGKIEVSYFYDTPTNGPKLNLKEEVFNYLEELESYQGWALLQENSRKRMRASFLAAALREFPESPAA
jgi:hypothetical protein